MDSHDLKKRFSLQTLLYQEPNNLPVFEYQYLQVLNKPIVKDLSLCYWTVCYWTMNDSS